MPAAAETQIHGLIALQFLALGVRQQRKQQISRALGSQRRACGVRQNAANTQSYGHIGNQQQI